MKVFAVIPVFNENQWVLQVVQGALTYVNEVVLVDDGSRQEKCAWSQQLPPHVTLLHHPINLGKGAALKTGCAYALQHGAEVIVFMDGDGQHVPSDLPKLLQPLEDGICDIVFGSRTIGKDMPLVMMLGNKFLSLACSIFFGSYISDTQSGFRAFLASAFPKLKWESPRYAVETEMLVNAAKHKLRIHEVQIQTVYHDSYKGTTAIDGLRIFLNIVKWKFL